MNRRLALAAGVAFALCVALPKSVIAGTLGVPAGRAGIGPAQLAVVVNTADKLSVAIGDYYSRRRQIPKANLIRVSFDPNRDELPEKEFAAIRATVAARTGRPVQAYALTWARPWRVGCMSITAAFAFGFDSQYCASACNLTRPSPYFNAATSRPHDDLNMRPTMSIAAGDWAGAKALIDRGVASDGTQPVGTAYLVESNDPLRNSRVPEYVSVDNVLRRPFKIDVLHAEEVRDRDDVMFYFIGAVSVPDLATNRFLPGAIADHLTSFGGMLTASSGQMSSLRWLEAGATGSYGTVVEPCAFPEKFPNVLVVMSHYFAGETLIEAYWKSVVMPGQGLFIGEPLAAPFRPHNSY